MLLSPALNPSAPLGDLLKTVLLLFVQGSGLFISGGTVTLNSCDIYNNEVRDVSVAALHCLKSQRPHENAWASLVAHVSVFSCAGSESCYFPLP